MNVNFYLVTNGSAELADPDTEFDGIESVLVRADSEQEALALADEYDAGLTQIDNVWLPAEGRAVAALIRR